MYLYLEILLTAYFILSWFGSELIIWLSIAALSALQTVHILFYHLYKLVGQLGTVQQDDASIEHNVFWNESYFIASCGGVTVEVLKKYVQSQGEFDRDGVASYEGLCGEVNSPP